MKGRKASWDKRRRAGAFPPCYGNECGRCPHPCEHYEEWHKDQIAKANKRELHEWQHRFTKGW